MAKEGSIFLNLLNLSPKKIEDIIFAFKDPQRILDVKRRDLRGILSLRDNDAEEILTAQNSGVLDRELGLISKEKIEVIDIFDENYPSFLKEISYPPLVLYIKGDSGVLNKTLFAIVGTRIPTFYGISMAEDFSCKLSSLGFVIVSGLARGIDTAAHKGAIKKGETVAVLGSGLLNIYPGENKKLAQKISEKGAIISEFPLGEPPLRENFPRRNRIVSGLSRGVLVVEAAIRSGALITARLALEQNREVFALPGKADSPLSKGTHSLIKEGAKLVDSLEDILEELNMSAASIVL
ncbi:MAG: DNA-processing protein DprA [Candidatus Omnitrophica bacterium]|nr:DNA-processing protein DprA [Candidatus Omnitrophota bacterium]MBU0878626.1 DNA-processing protein DprA [Candidatus Omnitrophota bacterium]MBU0896836.1 DNA-processing protein DprA [Candidatus Omnitrophota bacterium]MBU1133315.1 DNA-processing protein DprA [Candidatus Omnitrophota bacterium]MBU1367319.1 DNA-processing protein DprA [Candidatus Omnitrophota bacterium]